MLRRQTGGQHGQTGEAKSIKLTPGVTSGLRVLPKFIVANSNSSLAILECRISPNPSMLRRQTGGQHGQTGEAKSIKLTPGVTSGLRVLPKFIVVHSNIQFGYPGMPDFAKSVYATPPNRWVAWSNRRSKVYKANSRSHFGISSPTKIYSRKIGENRGSLGGCLWRNCLPDYISSLRADAD